MTEGLPIGLCAAIERIESRDEPGIGVHEIRLNAQLRRPVTVEFKL